MSPSHKSRIAGCIAGIAIVAFAGTALHAQRQKPSVDPAKGKPSRNAPSAVKDARSGTDAGAKKEPATPKTPASNKGGNASPGKTKEEIQAEREKKLKESEDKTVENIEQTLVHGVHKDRSEAIGKILKLRRPENKQRLEPKVIAIINNELNADVRNKAIVVAGELQMKAAVPALIGAINDGTEELRVAATYALKRIGDTSCAATLAEKLKNQDLSKNSNFTEALLNALGEFKATQLATYAVNGIKNAKTTPGNREYLVIFLGRIEAREAKDFLLKLLKDEEEDLRVRSYAANALARMGTREAAKEIDGIIKTIESYSFTKKKKYYNLYIYCIAALSRLGDPAAVPRLVDALRSDSAEVRLKAISLIKEVKDKRTIDILKYKMNHDPSPKVQKAAREALAEIEAEDKKQTPASKSPDSAGPKSPERKKTDADAPAPKR